tara:strand:+ start:1084 stop:1278 length:195 start_codon:yes stop_codon:yes gene_type:complete
MGKYAKVELVIPESLVLDLKEQCGDSKDELQLSRRLIKKAAGMQETQIRISRNLVGDENPRRSE